MREGTGRVGCGIPLVLFVLLVSSVDCASSSSSPSPSPTVNPASQSLLENTIISSYISFFHANRHTGRRLIYRYNGTQPGFGNRISNLLTAFTLASLSKRILLVDWRHPYDLFTFYNPVIDLKYSAGDEEGGDQECNSVACKASLLSAVLPSHRTVTYSEGLLHGELRLVKDILRKHKDLEASKALRKILDEPLNEAQFFKKMFDSLVRPGKELAKLMSAHSKELEQEFVAVHARLGSGVHEFGPRWGNETQAGATIASCFAKHAMEFGDRMDISKFYLATDTTSFRPLFERELKKRGKEIMTIGKVEPIHTKDCAAHRQGCLQAVFEFMVMSKARAIVANKSTFSRAAGLVGGVDKFLMIKKLNC